MIGGGETTALDFIGAAQAITVSIVDTPTVTGDVPAEAAVVPAAPTSEATTGEGTVSE
ncbi:MAG: hypothetical protein SGI73_17000 [Chloroflexota bacterium]|nr:hypothetical protein [Chloroflexota bacterium]